VKRSQISSFDLCDEVKEGLEGHKDDCDSVETLDYQVKYEDNLLSQKLDGSHGLSRDDLVW